MPADNPASYRVLARTTRPTRLSELIGQDALVRTLTNAMASGRLAHAFLLTGIRGVGKTTTARIIARALNCIGPDGKGGVTPEPCGVCEHCVAIAGDHHLDVIEMDAATRTGIDDIREIVGSVRYAPGSARFKVYIIDEVHMLSEKAFNGLLKTLEEPPPHARFVFATTEVRKIPVTVLSRCQRFDLRRIETPRLVEHLTAIGANEKIEVEDAALEMMARGAEGSVRDALSLFDQAIAMGEGKVTSELVRDMMGLADRSHLLGLFDALMAGEPGHALERLEALHAMGAAPHSVIRDLLDLCHWLSRARVVKGATNSLGLSSEDFSRGRGMAERLPQPVLARTWQMLLRGLEEVRQAPSPMMAAEMLLLRIAHISDLPPPAELAALARRGPSAPARGASPSGAPAPAPPSEPQRSEDISNAPDAPPAQPPADHGTSGGPTSLAACVKLLRGAGETMLATWLHASAHEVRVEPGRIVMRLESGAPGDLSARLSEFLQRQTGRRWMIALSNDDGAPTLAEQAEIYRRQRIAEASENATVRAVLDQFPGATVVDVRDRRQTAKPQALHANRRHLDR